MSAPTRRAEIRGGNSTTNKRKKQNERSRRSPEFLQDSHSSSLCWLPESVRGRLLHSAASALRPQSPAFHFQSKRRASTRGRAELAPTTLAAVSKVPHLKARAHRERTLQPLLGGVESTGSQVRPPGSSPISATWELCDLK